MADASGLQHFSLVVTCYNLEPYIGECLDSLAGLDYPANHFEILCVDDGSTDRSSSILRRYRPKVHNLILLETANAGLEKACNLGIRAARYPWIVRVDGDDLLSPNCLSGLSAGMAGRPEHDFYYCKRYVEYHSRQSQISKELPDFDAEEIFKRGDFFATGTAYKKQDLLAMGGFQERVKNCGLENYELILRMIASGKTGFAAAAAEFFYRRHQTNMSIERRAFIIEYGKKLLEGYRREFVTNQFHPYGLKLPSVHK